jgi:hypothetical protein
MLGVIIFVGLGYACAAPLTKSQLWLVLFSTFLAALLWWDATLKAYIQSQIQQLAFWVGFGRASEESPQSGQK